MSGLPGRIGKYQLIERIGAGGMGEVFHAELSGDGGFVRKVALKLILPEQARKPRYQELFLREARCLAALRHRGIVQVFEQGSEDGRLYLAMELLEGRTLRELLAELGPIPWQAAAFVVAEVAQALAAAHELRSTAAPDGLVHGDLSPSNVMLCFDGGVKVLDFGLTRAAGSEQSVSGVQGKLPYLPPESLSGAASDPRADIYAAGVILHELLTGRPLFRGTNELETMHRVMHETVAAPSQTAPDVPPALDDIVARAMARDRAQRYASARAFADALDEVLAGQVGAARLHKWLTSLAPRSASAPAMIDSATVPSPRRRREDDDDATLAASRSSATSPSVSAPIASVSARIASTPARRRALPALALVGALGLGVVATLVPWSRPAPAAPAPAAIPAPARVVDLPAPTQLPAALPAPAPARPATAQGTRPRRPRHVEPVARPAPEGISPGLLANPFHKK